MAVTPATVPVPVLIEEGWMTPVFHLVAPEVWEKAPADGYRADSLATEGFIHCSYARQVADVANRFYADAPALLVLTLDPGRLTSPLRDEPAAGDQFPHVYGPINREAVVGCTPLARNPQGQWVFNG
jgi:uncharacterized protein (DUF952 family)